MFNDRLLVVAVAAVVLLSTRLPPALAIPAPGRGLQKLWQDARVQQLPMLYVVDGKVQTIPRLAGQQDDKAPIAKRSICLFNCKTTCIGSRCTGKKKWDTTAVSQTDWGRGISKWRWRTSKKTSRRREQDTLRTRFGHFVFPNICVECCTRKKLLVINSFNWVMNTCPQFATTFCCER